MLSGFFTELLNYWPASRNASKLVQKVPLSFISFLTQDTKPDGTIGPPFEFCSALSGFFRFFLSLKGLPSIFFGILQPTEVSKHHSAQASFSLLFVESGTRKLRKVVESRTKFLFDVKRFLDSTTVPVLDSTPILLL